MTESTNLTELTEFSIFRSPWYLQPWPASSVAITFKRVLTQKAWKSSQSAYLFILSQRHKKTLSLPRKTVQITEVFLDVGPRVMKMHQRRERSTLHRHPCSVFPWTLAGGRRAPGSVMQKYDSKRKIQQVMNFKTCNLSANATPATSFLPSPWSTLIAVHR